jgi:calcineurin-like phosphoesterase family protein
MKDSFSIISNREKLLFRTAKDCKHLFTSDTHYGHGNIIKYSTRPFMTLEEEEFHKQGVFFKVSKESVDRMNSVIIEKFNEVARPQDWIWHLGDLGWHGVTSAKEFIDKLNCKNIIFIWGNHDDPRIIDLIPKQTVYIEGGLEEKVISPCFDQALAIIRHRKIHLNHYPCDSWEGSHHGWWSLYGHVHGTKNNRHIKNPLHALSLDVGVDSHDFYPWTFEQINELFEKRALIWKSGIEGKNKDNGGMTPVCKIE